MRDKQTDLMLQTRTITRNDKIDELVTQINEARWDNANDMCAYDAPSLKAYLAHPDTLFIACYDIADEGATLMGIASSRLELKPYGGERWLYVDEVDVCADQRCRGAGKQIMQHLIEIAREQGCEELWLGTEVDNTAANALYKSLGPDEIEHFIGYTFETDE